MLENVGHLPINEDLPMTTHWLNRRVFFERSILEQILNLFLQRGSSHGRDSLSGRAVRGKAGWTPASPVVGCCR